jgi:sirohydrochlorin cobaltochelatase
MSEPAVLLCGHGSRDDSAVTEFERLAEHISVRLPKRRVTHGFLEFARPTIGTKLDALQESGARLIDAVPGMLFAAGHAKNDIPSVLNNYAAENPAVTIRYGRDLAIDPLLLRAASERIEAVDDPNGPGRADSLLVVVGRGTSDSDANSNISKVTRMLWEGMGFGWAETCYSGVTQPLVGPALERVARLGFPRIVVFPYFLFTGVLVKRIYDATDAAARAHPDITFHKASYLNDHPLVIDAFLARIAEIPEGDNRMNCQLCKYREQILGYEADHGAPQVGHHHHVEGIGTDADHDQKDHHHGHGHGDHRHD